MAIDFNKRISRNVLATIAQVLISGVVFFILYRYLYDKLGVQLIGVWSLVLATTAASRIGDLGLSAGVVRFVAKALGENNPQRAADVVETVALTLGLTMAVLLVICYPLFVMILGYFLPPQGLPPAIKILPYALISLWLMVIVSVFSGGLDGCMRMDLRSFLMAISHLAYLVLTTLLVPKYGLKGVAIAQLAQFSGLLIMLWWLLKRQLKSLSIIPLQWKFPVLKEMIGYGVNFQIITLMSMLFDPLVKALISKFGDLESLGYYEMANKLILQGRALIVEASRVMVAAIASQRESDATKSTSLFVTSYTLTFYVSVLFYGALGIFATTISMLWLGHYQEMFIFFVLMLNLGWFANTLIGPAYFYNLGSGKLRGNMISHAIMSITSLVAGLILGSKYGGLGVVIGAVTGLIAGSMFLSISHVKQIDLHWPTFIFPKNMINLLIFAVFLTGVSNFIADQKSSLSIFAGVALLSSLIFLSFGWQNPARQILRRAQQ